MRKVLILKFPYSSLFGGGEKHTLLMVEGLRQKGFEFYLASSCPVLLREFKKRRYPAKKIFLNKEPVSKGAILAWLFLWPYDLMLVVGLLLYYRFLKKVRTVYCLSLTEKILATWPARCLGMKVIWAEHVTVERWLSKNPLRIFYKLMSKAAIIIAVSKIVAKQLVEIIRVKRENIKVVYNGVDLRQFTMSSQRWQNSARFNVGCIARLEKEKGIEFLIQAMRIIREFIPFARLIVVGEGPERKKLSWLASRLELGEAIQWVGYQQEVEKWYSYFDAYVLPSVKRESFGITLVEAMARGVPVVGSKIGGIPEVIEHKKTGLLAMPGQSQDLADQLIFIYNHRQEAKKMAIQARKKVEENFSLDRMLRDLYILFTK